MKKILLLFIFLLIFNFTLAQVYPYFSGKKSANGYLIGVEVIDKKSNKTLDFKNYEFSWIIPQIFSLAIKTNSNVLSIVSDRVFSKFDIDLTLNNSDGQSYNLSNEVNLKMPRVKIVKKEGNFLYPLSYKVSKSDSLTVLVDGFSSERLKYMWDFDYSFITKEKDLPLSLLPENQGVVRVMVFGVSPNEKALDSQIIRIE